MYILVDVPPIIHVHAAIRVIYTESVKILKINLKQWIRTDDVTHMGPLGFLVLASLNSARQ